MTAPASSSATPSSAAAPLLPALGAILAGGASSRYGGIKALATVGGSAILERARRVVAETVTHPVLITHLQQIAEAGRLPSRPDASAGGGPLAGIDTALRWALELRLPGALCVACDLPFLPASLLREIVAEALDGEMLALAPESVAPAGFEPLCAWYSTRALASIQQAVADGERRVTRVAEALSAARLPLARVAVHGDPAVIFLNVNTPDGRIEADRIATRQGRGLSSRARVTTYPRARRATSRSLRASFPLSRPLVRGDRRAPPQALCPDRPRRRGRPRPDRLQRRRCASRGRPRGRRHRRERRGGGAERDRGALARAALAVAVAVGVGLPERGPDRRQGEGARGAGVRREGGPDPADRAQVLRRSDRRARGLSA
ncbi:MAG: molybdenum cofactor guanylyltransferase, partial [Gemmatimonadetes bacterium]|nr:molybdenum cofactor guanylyltransferase [Gemmatimonadota bacterium]